MRRTRGAGSLDGAGIEAWLNFEHEALLWGVDPEIGREELEVLIEASTVSLGRDDHRAFHSEATDFASDFARWGRRGGLETLRRYGRGWFALLGRRRHGRLTPAQLTAAAAELSG